MVKNLRLIAYSSLIVCTTLVQCTQKPEKKNQPINKVETTVKEKKNNSKRIQTFYKRHHYTKKLHCFF